jgi:hypothetical protein
LFYTKIPENVPERRIEVEPEPELNEYYVDNYVVRDFLNRAITADTQNVHDTVIQNNVKNKYKSLPSNYSDIDSTIRDIMVFCDNCPDILDTVNKIKQRNATVVNFEGNAESDILKKTWNGANAAVKAQIINELRDCKKGSDIYCPTGVATRIVSATYIESPDNYPKDKNSINAEILGKCAHLRNKNPDITPNEMKEMIIEEYSTIHDRAFISDLTEEWLPYI